MLEIFENRRKIWEGLRNKIFKQEHVEAIYNARLEVCKACRLYDTTGDGCTIPGTGPCCNRHMSESIDGKESKGCGCSLGLKLRSLSSNCPLDKWKAVATDKEEDMIKKQIHDSGQG